MKPLEIGTPLSDGFSSNCSRARVVLLMAILAFSVEGGAELTAAKAEFRRTEESKASKESLTSGGESACMVGWISRYRIDSAINEARAEADAEYYPHRVLTLVFLQGEVGFTFAK